jgi:hypothetical protein
MDAQDVRIAELSADNDKLLEWVGKVAEIVGQPNGSIDSLPTAVSKHIAKLERKIREARELMVSFAYGGRPFEAVNQWLERNAERKKSL